MLFIFHASQSANDFSSALVGLASFPDSETAAYLGVKTLGLHATWLFNSATHMWGSRRFNTRDDSRNNWWVAVLTGGEGWHNNHHAHPVSARHGLTWYEFDLNYYGIWMMGHLGLAKRINALTVAQTATDSFKTGL